MGVCVWGRAGDLLLTINGQAVRSEAFHDIMQLLRHMDYPLHLTFARTTAHAYSVPTAPKVTEEKQISKGSQMTLKDHTTGKWMEVSVTVANSPEKVKAHTLGGCRLILCRIKCLCALRQDFQSAA